MRTVAELAIPIPVHACVYACTGAKTQSQKSVIAAGQRSSVFRSILVNSANNAHLNHILIHQCLTQASPGGHRTMPPDKGTTNQKAAPCQSSPHTGPGPHPRRSSSAKCTVATCPPITSFVAARRRAVSSHWHIHERFSLSESKETCLLVAPASCINGYFQEKLVLRITRAHSTRND